jgi:light-harvesting complex 1 beta chain
MIAGPSTKAPGSDWLGIEPHRAASYAGWPANVIIRPVSEASMNEAQAKEFHEQFKVTFSAFMGLAAVAHLLVYAATPWF